MAEETFANKTGRASGWGKSSDSEFPLNELVDRIHNFTFMQPAKAARRAGCINYKFKLQSMTALIVAQRTYYAIKLIKKGRTRNTLTNKPNNNQPQSIWVHCIKHGLGGFCHVRAAVSFPCMRISAINVMHA
jgi:hypothetical protein